MATTISSILHSKGVAWLAPFLMSLSVPTLVQVMSGASLKRDSQKNSRFIRAKNVPLGMDCMMYDFGALRQRSLSYKRESSGASSGIFPSWECKF